MRIGSLPARALLSALTTGTSSLGAPPEFLTGPAPATAPFTGLQGGVDILDAHTGRLLLRVILPEPFAMLSADVDGLHGRFLAIDENGQRIFARTASGSSNSRGSCQESEQSLRSAVLRHAARP